MVGLLALLSLTLLSIYFRESPGGPLHDAQGAGAAVLRPLQVGAERVARPFRDLYGWFDGLVDAKSDNEQLRARVERLQRKVIENQTAAREVERLKEQLAFHDLPSLRDFRQVNTRVIGYPAKNEVVIAAGSRDGVRVDAPVLSVGASGGALVGVVTRITGRTALVTLINDETSAVAASSLRTGATGLLQPGPGTSLVLDRVTKRKDVVAEDLIVTAGSRVGRLPSLFPRGIPIGYVTHASQTDTDEFKHIQVEPLVDLTDIFAVTVLVR